MTTLRESQTLLFDADDTLWEDNIYFERAFDAFVNGLQHETLTPVEIRAVFDEIGREPIANLCDTTIITDEKRPQACR